MIQLYIAEILNQTILCIAEFPDSLIGYIGTCADVIVDELRYRLALNSGIDNPMFGE
ncbi:MAG: hypothetical protein ACON5J_20305 [Rubripirellula sp.]